eukprot:315100-Chlamydomonas_euryale.AAC.1
MPRHGRQLPQRRRQRASLAGVRAAGVEHAATNGRLTLIVQHSKEARVATEHPAKYTCAHVPVRLQAGWWWWVVVVVVVVGSIAYVATIV